MADKTSDGSTETTSTSTPDDGATEAAPRRRILPSFGSGGRGSGRGGDRDGGRAGGGFDVSKARTVLARILWGVCALFALVLALAALLIALEANPENELVRWIIDRASNVDLGFFDLTNPIKDFDEAQRNPAKDVKTALFNYGIAAVIWLIIGRILDRVARP
jgi:hypothetical protein